MSFLNITTAYMISHVSMLVSFLCVCVCVCAYVRARARAENIDTHSSILFQDGRTNSDKTVGQMKRVNNLNKLNNPWPCFLCGQLS